MSKLIKSNKRVLLVGDFNCKEINSEMFKAGGTETTWGERFLKVTMENTMMQWVSENGRYRGDDEPTRLDLILTKGINLAKESRYVCSMGKSDHVIIERETINDVSEEVESHKENKRNYGKMNIDELKKLYEEMNWEKLKRANDVQDKYDIFFL